MAFKLNHKINVGRIISKEVRNKHSKSMIGKNITHGFSNTKFYFIFKSLKNRCDRPGVKSYERYGGRGIKCLWNSFDEFKNDMYESYLQHIKEFGSDTSIDRINNNGNYCKENCKWSTMKEQQSHRSNSRIIEFNGESMTLSQWSEKTGIPDSTLYNRFKNNNFFI